MINKKGPVVKKSGDKTIKVQIVEYVQHPKYKKRYPKSRNFLVHDENNVAEVGQIVEIAQSARRSKNKSWELVTDTK